jgi:cephalosporin hydroxylase
MKINKMKAAFTKTPINEKVEIGLKGLDSGHYNLTYKGIKAIKCPNDYVLYQMIIDEVRPDLIIEIGCNQGGGSMYLADLLAIYNIDGQIHAIDIHSEAKVNFSQYRNIQLFDRGYENYDIDITRKFKRVLVIEDAAHTYECTMGAIEKFASVVSKDSYLIVEDGIIDALGLSKEYNGGPLRAIREFLPHHPEFVVERKWCDFFGRNATFNVNGYLKRISA